MKVSVFVHLHIIENPTIVHGSQHLQFLRSFIFYTRLIRFRVAGVEPIPADTGSEAGFTPKEFLAMYVMLSCVFTVRDFTRVIKCFSKRTMEKK